MGCCCCKKATKFSTNGGKSVQVKRTTPSRTWKTKYCNRQELVVKITEMYQFYNPDKLKDESFLPAMLETYKGNESTLYGQLIALYGPPPLKKGNQKNMNKTLKNTKINEMRSNPLQMKKKESDFTSTNTNNNEYKNKIPTVSNPVARAICVK